MVVNIPKAFTPGEKRVDVTISFSFLLSDLIGGIEELNELYDGELMDCIENCFDNPIDMALNMGDEVTWHDVMATVEDNEPLTEVA